jgi:uncharacterized membrane protein YbhN (UPF0104 family)
VAAQLVAPQEGLSSVSKTIIIIIIIIIVVVVVLLLFFVCICTFFLSFSLYNWPPGC